ncbi:MAG: carbohydrate ABC transporter permease [Saccharofermentanales bacterium]
MKRGLSISKRWSIAGYIFVSPFILGFGLFMLYPLISNLRFSFGKITEIVGLQTEYVGFENYIKLFETDVKFAPAFLATIQQTFLWTPFIIVVALFLAILLNRKIKGKGLFRVIFFLPVLLGTGYVMQSVGGAASVLTMPQIVTDFFQNFFSANVAGFIDKLLTQILANMWDTGVPIVIFLSGLQVIPDTYYEAARIDGANGIEQFWRITLPLLSPVILLNLVYTIIEGFRSTDNAIAYLIVNTVFVNARYEYGAAMGWIYFIVVLLAIGIVFLMTRKLVNYEK